MLHGAASFLTVLIAAALLGVEVWVVGIVALGYVVTRPALGPAVVGRALLPLAVSAVAYVAIVILMVALVPP
jgi:hypothetical protein